VQVLTIHGSKGLDFEHVYLVQLHKAPPPGDRAGRTEVGRLDDDEAPNGNRFEYRLFGAATLGFDQIEAERREVEAAERVRLLYVAMTRAKDRLVLAGTWPDDTDPRPWEHARSPMDLLLSRAVLPADLAASWSDVIDQKTWSFVDDAGALWKFPALRPELEALTAEETEGPDLPEPEEIALAAGTLEIKREEARARMDRPFSGAASEEAHHLLREEQAEARVAPEVEEARQRRKGKRTPELDREAAMAAGGAIHRVLETWDLTADPRKEAGRQRSLLPEYLAALVEGEILDQALPRALDLLDQFLEGPLLARFRNLDGHVLARELPVLLPPTESPTAPIGVIAGAIDLLYRDPKTKALVIADYKTDDLETEADLNRRAATYAHQGAVYVRALQDALELPDLPRFELWFLRAGRVVEA
jgi:ATP-dependent helicase/nuclease subunit A